MITCNCGQTFEGGTHWPIHGTIDGGRCPMSGLPVDTPRPVVVTINARQTFNNAAGTSRMSVTVSYDGVLIGVLPLANGSHGMEWTYAAELFEAAGIPSPDPEGREWTRALMGSRGVKVLRDYVYVSRLGDLHDHGKGGAKIYAKWRGGALVDALSLI